MKREFIEQNYASGEKVKHEAYALSLLPTFREL